MHCVHIAPCDVGWMSGTERKPKRGLTTSERHDIVVSQHAKVAQLVEHSTENAGVVSSILSLGTFHI